MKSPREGYKQRAPGASVTACRNGSKCALSLPKSPPSWSSPLGIIALFLTVTETVTGIAVMQAAGGIQIALTCYVIVLPLLVLAAFFFVLWHKPYVLYPPSEYGRGVDLRGTHPCLAGVPDDGENRIGMALNAIPSDG